MVIRNLAGARSAKSAGSISGCARPRRTLLAVALAALFSGQAHAVDYDWNSGTYPASYPTTLDVPDNLNINTVLDKFLTAITLTNNSTVTWNAGNVFLNGSTVNNSGLWDVKGDNGLNDYLNISTFNNSGILRKSGGTGTTTVNTGLVNTGTLDAQTGTIDYVNNRIQFNDGTAFTGAGVNRVSGNTQFSGGFSSQNLSIQGGTQTGAGAQLTGGQVEFTSGTLAGDWTLQGGTTLNLATSINKFLGSAVITSNGTVDWAAGSLYLNGSTVNNTGLWDATADNGLNDYLNVSTFNNSGILRKSGGAGTTTVDTGLVNTGTLDAQTGTINYVNSRIHFQDGTAFTGAGVNRVSGNTQFSGGFSSQNLSIQGGTQTGAGAQLTGGQVEFTSGDLTGDWTLQGGTTLNLATSINKFLTSAVITNNGTVAWNAGSVFLNGATVNNAGLWDAKADNGLNDHLNVSTFNNSGILRKSGGTGTTTVNTGLVNTGTLDAQTGTIDYVNNRIQFNDGTAFTGAGVNRVAGNVSFSGGFTSQNLSIQSGDVTGAGAGATLTGGQVGFSGGNLQGTWTLDNGTALNLVSATNKFLTGATINNAGTVAWTAGNLYLNGSTVNNTGLWDAQADNSLNNNLNVSTFNNNGTLRKSGGSGTTLINTGFANTAGGTVNVQTGTLRLAQGFDNQGIVDVAAGTRFAVNGASFTSSGILRGDGTIDPATVLSSSGIVQPGGNGTGQLTIDGAFQATGGSQIDIQLGGLGDYDVLNILGNGSWGGTLKVSALGGYLPQVNDVFTIALFSGTGSGTFTLDATSMPRVTFQTVYDTHAIRLAVLAVNPVPVPPAVWLFASGLLGLIGVARRRQAGE